MPTGGHGGWESPVIHTSATFAGPGVKTRSSAQSSTTAACFTVYNGLFFVVHRYAWSLSAFNKEARIQAFFNGRMLETAIAGLLGCILAALVYLKLRPAPKGVTAGFAAGWLSLGAATALTIQSLLGFQVAWFLWQWSAQSVWRLPDFTWGFKFDLDLIQMTAIAGVALLGPPSTYLVGRFHPRVASDCPS